MILLLPGLYPFILAVVLAKCLEQMVLISLEAI
jgi:hypothetical protein